MNAIEFRNRIFELYDNDATFAPWVCGELDGWVGDIRKQYARMRLDDKLHSDFQSTGDYIAWLTANPHVTNQAEPVLQANRFPLPNDRQLSRREQAVVVTCLFNLHPEGRPKLRPSTPNAMLHVEIACYEVLFDHLESISDSTIALFWNRLAIRFPRNPLGVQQVETSDTSTDAIPKEREEALEMLFGWPEICREVKRPAPEEVTTHKQIKKLNDDFRGTIICGGKGVPPRVSRCKLVRWWNRLSELFEESRHGDSAGSIDTTVVPFGKSGNAVPGIRGEMKRPRSDKGKRRSEKKDEAN